MSFSGKPYGINPSTGLMEPLTNISGLSNLYFVRVATTANLTASYSNKVLTNTGALAALSIDGVTLSVNDKVLVKNQTTATQNGLYTVTIAGNGSTAWQLTRSTDMDTATEVEERDWFWATEGTTNAGTGYVLTTSGTITLDSTSLTFTKVLGGALQASNNLSDLTSASTARTNLGLGTIATAASSAYLAAANNLSDIGNAATARTNLGLGSASSSSSSDFLPNYVADSWTFEWLTATGDPLSNSWTNGGTQNATTASTTQGGVACYSITPSGSSGTSYIKYNTTAATGNWELRLKAYFPVSSGTTQNFGFSYTPDTTQAASKRFQYMFTAGGIQSWNGAAMVSIVSCPDLTARWIDITIRTYVTGTGLANTWQEIWIGKLLMWAGLVPTSLGSSLSAGDIAIGRLTAGTTASVSYIADVAFKNGINSAPPSYTFNASTWPL